MCFCESAFRRASSPRRALWPRRRLGIQDLNSAARQAYITGPRPTTHDPRPTTHDPRPTTDRSLADSIRVMTLLPARFGSGASKTCRSLRSIAQRVHLILYTAVLVANSPCALPSQIKVYRASLFNLCWPMLWQWHPAGNAPLKSRAVSARSSHPDERSE